MNTPLQKLNCKTVLCFLILSVGIRNPACGLSLYHLTDRMASISVHTKRPCFYTSDASLTAPSQGELRFHKASAVGAAGTEQDSEYNTLCWRVILPEKSVCFCKIEIRTLSFFWAAQVGLLVRRVWDTKCIGDCLDWHASKARNLVLNERHIRDHHCLLESKQRWRSGRAGPG